MEIEILLVKDINRLPEHCEKCLSATRKFKLLKCLPLPSIPAREYITHRL